MLERKFFYSHLAAQRNDQPVLPRIDELDRAARRRTHALLLLGLFGATLFYGDSVITPAISVMGAIEGLEVVTPTLKPYVLPISAAILVGLFVVQRFGTAAVGKVFGPVIVLWFGVLGAIGFTHIVQQPQILAALNPLEAWAFLSQRGWHLFAAVGAIVLALTGAEALYADMGHFGVKPIRLAWTGLVFPALALNYLGQGALLMGDPGAIENPFFRLFPATLVLPMVGLAALAAVIASQAVISGVFTITQQCQQLGYIPRVRVLHSSASLIGQVYVPAVNWLSCVATIALAIGFGSSARITHAYGVGVSCTMLIDTILIFLLLWGATRHRDRLQLFIVCGLLALDAAFVVSNMDKVPTGGWFPLAFGFAVFGVMKTWQRGRLIVVDKMRREERPVTAFLEMLEREPPVRVEGVAVFPTSNTTGIPRTLVRNLKMNGVLHEHTIIFSLVTERVPRVSEGGRVKVQTLAPGLYRVIARMTRS